MSLRLSSLERALDRFTDDDGVVCGIGLARDLATASAGAPAERWAGVLTDLLDRPDQLAAIGAIHALAGLAGDTADAALGAMLDDDRQFVVEHAAWALSARAPHRPSMLPLAGIVAGAGGFVGMLAQRTLEGWAATDGRGVAAATLRALGAATTDESRARLVETVGLIRGSRPLDVLQQVARDEDEGFATRAAAVAALGDRPGDPSVLLALTTADDELAVRAVLALHDQAGLDRPEIRPPEPGVRIGQVFVHADFGAGDGAGAGDHGGIATLLDVLAVELDRLDDVADVVSIGRGAVEDALLIGWPRSSLGPGGATIPFGPPGGVELRRAWPYRVEIERGIRRVVRSLPGLDVLHLRMADVGTLAAARVARRHGLPVVFTAAPDPHGVIEAMEAAGELDRRRFGVSDVAEHWWFRARMVERLVVQAEHVVLLPRPDGRRQLARLLGTDDLDGSSTVIPEGVHAATVLAAREAVASRRLTELGPTVDDLLAAVSRLPAWRRRLPLVVSVGRLHPAKGMARVVRAWRQTLARTTNLVIVGGDLTTPSPDERDVLAAITDLATEADGLILLGRQPHGGVARLLEVAAGRSTPALPCGIYVAGSRKEEFGLAIVEALAAGLPVVAPAAGGPSTYVRDGVDGVLLHDQTTGALTDAMGRALGLALVPDRAAAATAKVLGELTIERMARRLADVYLDLVAARAAAP